MWLSRSSNQTEKKLYRALGVCDMIFIRNNRLIVCDSMEEKLNKDIQFHLIIFISYLSYLVDIFCYLLLNTLEAII